jgi:hypothetical protein
MLVTGPHERAAVPRAVSRERTHMKYICLGYLDEPRWATYTPEQQLAMIDECCAYDEHLQASGHWVGGEGLGQPGAIVRWAGGKASITDGPFAETKEQLGGILIIEARDLNHALELISKHPGIKMGPFEVRPAADLSAMVAESAKRRAAKRK